MIDWNDAFNTLAFVKDPSSLGDRWAELAARARADMRSTLDIRYGPHKRQVFDLFEPSGPSQGLVVFIHGGFWHRFNKSFWSHMACGPVQQGWSTAVISYPLAPDVRIADITKSAAIAVNTAATKVQGPICLAGHSAGGHLVTRLASSPDLLEPPVQKRLRRTVSISGVHDLRPLYQTALNNILRLTHDEATAESPAVRPPALACPTTFWVGAGERPEFLRQTRLIGEIWGQAGADVSEVYDTGKDHFTVVDALTDKDSPLTQALLS